MFSRGFCILPTSTNHNLTHPTSWKGRFAVLELQHQIVNLMRFQEPPESICVGRFDGQG